MAKVQVFNLHFERFLRELDALEPQQVAGGEGLANLRPYLEGNSPEAAYYGALLDASKQNKNLAKSVFLPVTRDIYQGNDVVFQAIAPA